LPDRKDLISKLISAATNGEAEMKDADISLEASNMIFAGQSNKPYPVNVRNGYNFKHPDISLLRDGNQSGMAKSTSRRAQGYWIPFGRAVSDTAMDVRLKFGSFGRGGERSITSPFRGAGKPLA
jgi:hypothetical protein